MKIDADHEEVCCFSLHAVMQHKVRKGEWGEGECSEQVEGVHGWGLQGREGGWGLGGQFLY